jgi:2'-5' RNA ligase
VPEHKLFFALQPDAEASERIWRLADELRRRHGLIGRPIPRERLHLSLIFAGGFRGPPPSAVVEKARAAADKVSATAFAISLNRAESWKGDPHPLVLTGEEGVIGVQILHAAIHRPLARAGMAPRREPEHWPHITLLRDQGQVPKTFVEPVTWTIREFVLLDSVQGEGRHELLGRWPLG